MTFEKYDIVYSRDDLIPNVLEEWQEPVDRFVLDTCVYIKWLIVSCNDN